MKIAFMIQAHAEPDVLRRLVLALNAPWVTIFIHIDLKFDLEPFTNALAGFQNVTLIQDRIPVYWGGWSQVKATLKLIRAAQTSGHSFDRYALLSGACYPLRSNEKIRDFLSHSDHEYISALPMPDVATDKHLWRLTKRHFEGGDNVAGFKARCIGFTNRINKHLPDRKLKIPFGFGKPFAGSQWWILSRQAIELVLSVLDNHSNFVDLFRHSYCPDECFFHTIVANSSLYDRISKSLTFADWTRPEERPCFIDERHLQLLFSKSLSIVDEYGTGPVMFARKFGNRNQHIADYIDARRI